MKKIFLLIFLTSLIYSQAILHSPVEKSIEKTPAKIVDKFMMYRHESDHAIEYIKEEKIKEKKRKNA